jgi:multimeric flavodoxin WrbA
MSKNILVLSGSPKRNGNTAALIEWFRRGACQKGARVTVVHALDLGYKTQGCISCRLCQTREAYGCVIQDGLKPVLQMMIESDAIVFATPLYFFSASAQIKMVLDRMFSLYKWDNEAGTMDTPLKGKMLVVMASAFEDVGLDVLAKPFKLTAEYTGMKFRSLLIPNAGVSGEIKKKVGISKKAFAFGEAVAKG